MPDTASPSSIPLSESSHTPRVWFSIGPLPVTTRRLVWPLTLLLIGVLLAVFWRQIDVEAVHAYADQLPGWMIFSAISVAPLVGVPVAMLHVVAGVRFGIEGGLVVVAITTVIHHLAGWSLVQVAPHLFRKHLSDWRRRFPKGAHLPITVFCCLMPGMPYSIQLYLLPVLGVPVSILLLVSAPLHVIRAIVSVLGGHLSDQMTPGRIAALVVYYCVLTLICSLALRRLRTILRHPDKPKA